LGRFSGNVGEEKEKDEEDEEDEDFILLFPSEAEEAMGGKEVKCKLNLNTFSFLRSEELNKITSRPVCLFD
jgi:hypothetical protein